MQQRCTERRCASPAIVMQILGNSAFSTSSEEMIHSICKGRCLGDSTRRTCIHSKQMREKMFVSEDKAASFAHSKTKRLTGIGILKTQKLFLPWNEQRYRRYDDVVKLTFCS